MTQCTFIKAGGERCKGVPVRGSTLCAAHHPDYQGQRRAGARRGGKARGPGEMAGIKAEIKAVIEAVKTGELDRGDGAVVFQGYNTLLRAVEVERRVREQEEVEARLQVVEQALESAAGEARRERPWGA
jgi:hypothetical protein